jgi:cob(I)alamin adenosyltransferase
MWYTRGGDRGTTGLFGKPERVSKTDPVIEALGSIDELVSFTGLARSKAKEVEKKILLDVQHALFTIQAQVAGAEKELEGDRVVALEKLVDEIEVSLPPVKTFLIPGETEQGALYDVCRTISRRVERVVLRWIESGAPLPDSSRQYLNRLSSLFYALARQESMRSGITEEPPTYG